MTALVVIGCITIVLVVALLVGSSIAKHSITKRAEVDKALAPPEEPVLPLPEQQALSAILQRRKELEENITDLRHRATTTPGWNEKHDWHAKARTDSLTALNDARAEQKELIEEQAKLLEKMRVRVDDEHMDAGPPAYVSVGMEDEMAAPQWQPQKSSVRRS